ncbi:MAG TPA: FHA domain-containing protein [Mycobacteriales bacterium]|nr:FHA domain-containing protein [Mycobacteriales bacterium]
MGSALVVALVKYGLLALLWVFVLLVVRAVREDLWGRTVPVAPPPARATPEAKPKRRRGSPRQLVVTEGPLQGTTITLGETPVTLGRGNDCTLVLADDYASTHHARLVPGEGGWLVEDLGSTNGTYLGRAKVTRPMPVPLGTPIRIGKTSMELRT